MKDKEKQIDCNTCLHKEICFYQEEVNDCNEWAKEFGCEYYEQKLPEDSVVNTPTIQTYSTHDNDLVVLTREEFEELKQAKTLLEFREETIKYLEDANIRYNEALELKVNKKERKKTAEEILQIIDLIDKKYQNIAKEELHSGTIAKAFTVIATKIKTVIARKYGVEVE